MSFSIASNETVSKLSCVDITSHLLTTTFRRNILNHNSFGPDAWGNQLCIVCKQKYKNCNGHFGTYSNVLLYKTLYVPHVIKVLNNVCHVCKTSRESKDGVCKVCKTVKSKYLVYKHVKLYKSNKVEPITISRINSLGQMQIMSKESILEILNGLTPSVFEKMGIHVSSGDDMMWRVLPILSKRYRKDNKVGDRIVKNHLESLYQQMTRQVADRVSNMGNVDKLSKIDNTMQIIEMQLVDGDKYKRSDGSPNSTILPKIVKKDGMIISDLVCKRVNNCIRAVIIPANEHISISEIGIPRVYAQDMIVYEYVTIFNIHKLNDMLGSKEYPQIKYRKEIINGEEVDRSVAGIDRLNIGDLIARSLVTGDEVMANRAPTLTKHSILCFKARITEGKAISLNITTCAGYGADFDGDSMQIYALKHPRTRVESFMKMSSSENVFSGGFSGVLIAITQDLVACLRMLTTNLCFVSEHYARAILKHVKTSRIPVPSFAYRGDGRLEQLDEQYSDPVTVRKYVYVYSGKSLFSTLLPERFNYISFDDSDNMRIRVENGNLLEGEIDKFSIMKQQKGLINAICELYGEDKMVEFIDNMHVLASNMSKIYGLTTGLHDFYFSREQVNKILTIRNIKYRSLYNTISKYKIITPVIDMQISDEIKSIQNSNEVLSEIMKSEFHHFHDIITCGAKGTTGDVNKMSYSIGQVYVGADRYADRSPFVAKYDNLSRYGLGIVECGYLDGLSVVDIQMCNQNALNSSISTQLATAKPGYINTKVNETVRDYVFVCDFTIRNSLGEILMQHYFNSFDSEKESLYILKHDLEAILIKNGDEYNMANAELYNAYLLKLYQLIDVANKRLNKYEVVSKIGVYLPFDFDLLLRNNRVDGEICKDMQFIVSEIDKVLESYNTSPYPELDNVNKIPMAYALHLFFSPRRITESKETYNRMFGLIKEKIVYAQLEPGTQILLKSGTSYLSVVTQELLKSIHHQSRNAEKSLEDNFNVSKSNKNEIITSYVEDAEQNYRKLSMTELLSDVKCTFSKDLSKRKYKILYNDKDNENSLGLLFQFSLNMHTMISNRLLLPYIYVSIIENMTHLLESDPMLSKNVTYLHVSSSGIFDKPSISLLIDGNITNVRLFIIYLIKLVKEINIRETNIKSLYVVKREFKYKHCFIEGITYSDALSTKFLKRDHILTSNIYSVYEIFGMYGYLSASMVNLFLIGKDNKVNPKHGASISCVICYNNNLVSLNRQGLDKIAVGRWTTISFENQMNNLVKAALKRSVDYGLSMRSKTIYGHKLNTGTNHSIISYDLERIKTMSTFKLESPNENQLYNFLKKQNNSDN